MSFIDIIKAVCLLIGAAIIGNWFLSEVRDAKKQKKPWYKPYVSPPGLLILFAVIVLPLIAWIAGQ